ncbi:MAG: HlyD family efflux transporter periplasmic adaptor subunit, partial [Planctomycetes bacterium]|nr:HlyD family efflux transporter periplasmic adaptor subunit [Planctomycetota bacterium]
MPNSQGKMERMVSIAARAGVGIAALAASIALYAALVATKPQSEETSSVRPPALVRTIVATPVEVARAWEGFGTARAMNAADVSAEVSARVIERPEQIEAGAHVEAGDLLVRLDPIDFEQRVESAAQLAAALEADLESLTIEEFRIGEQVVLAAKEAEIRDREYARALNALESGGGNVAEVEQRLAALQRAQRELVALRQQADLIAPRRARLGAQLAGARADLALAQQDLDRTRIRAPITGVLQSIGPEVGELVGVGQAVARIVDTSRIEIPLRMPASSVHDIALGAPVSLRPDGPVASVWLGNVARIAPEADPSTRMVTLFVEVEQDHEAMGGGLMPGRFVVGT